MPESPPPVPDYTLLRPVGRGAYGEVWLARSVTGVYRAVKIVHRASFSEDRPFDREVRLRRAKPVKRIQKNFPGGRRSGTGILNAKTEMG